MSARPDAELAAARAALVARQGAGARYDAPSAPARELAWARLGMAYFARKLNELGDADLDAPSARAGWTRRRVVAACALQARAIAQALTLATGGTPEEVADTDDAALDLAETLPARALRHLVSHADVHLNVVWRDLDDAGWSASVGDVPGATTARGTAWLRARTLWTSALDLSNGGRLLDAPVEFREALAAALPREDVMTDLLFPAPLQPTVKVAGARAQFPVRRVFCVGRNYAAHAAEMGVEVDREAPFYFTKSALAVVPSGASVRYPPGTRNYHYEMELVVAIGEPAFRIPKDRAMTVVFGFACGLDMTRRDLQLVAREKGRPWDLGKDFEESTVVAPITRATEFGPIAGQAIRLTVDGETRQEARLSDLIWSVPELIADLSTFYHLAPGDLIFTGTSAGVGPVGPGANLRGEIDGLAPVALTIGEPA